MVAAAVIGSAVVGAGASYVSSSNAAKAQESAANQASSTEAAQYGQTRSDLLPYNTAGQNALNSISGNGYFNSPIALPGTMTQAQLEATPGYQFNLAQGLRATQNAAAARGLGASGAALKGAATYATGLADSTYQNQFANQQTLFNDQQTQQQNQYNRLAGIVNTGENAAAQTGSYGTQTAANIASNQLGAGNAAAASSIAGGNAIGGIGNNLSSMYLQNQLLQNNGYQGFFGNAPTMIPAGG